MGILPTDVKTLQKARQKSFYALQQMALQCMSRCFTDHTHYAITYIHLNIKILYSPPPPHTHTGSCCPIYGRAPAPPQGYRCCAGTYPTPGYHSWRAHSEDRETPGIEPGTSRSPDERSTGTGRRRELNPEPLDLQTNALPTELTDRLYFFQAEEVAAPRQRQPPGA